MGEEMGASLAMMCDILKAGTELDIWNNKVRRREVYKLERAEEVGETKFIDGRREEDRTYTGRQSLPQKK